MSSAYVISGVTGHVGSVAASELLSQGEKVTAIVRKSDRGAIWVERRAEVAVGSLDDREFLTKALTGAAGFFALLPPDTTEPDLYGLQRRTADSIAAAVKDSGVPLVVMLSSVGADLPDGTGPIKGLYYLEQALLRIGVKLLSIRAASFQENVAAAIPPAREAGIYPNFLPSADFTVPMIATRDIGHLAAELLKSPSASSENIDLLGPAYSVLQVSEKLGAALGKPLHIVDIPRSGQVEALKQAGVPHTVAEALAEMYAAVGSGLIKPGGDRTVIGKTTLDEVLPSLVART